VLEVGRVVQGYKIEGAVGTGSMGEVHKVRHLDRGTVHALKYLPLPAKKIRQRLLREAEVQTRLSHPNVVTLTEVIEVDGDPGLVMEFVDGPSLDIWLATNKPNLIEAEALFRGIVAGVAHAHRRDLVHRDLKPSNVLLARTSSGLIPKVSDFGIAKVLDSSSPSGASGLTRTGTSLGSPAYMAPEQVRDARMVDQTADIWSLGCILYELVLHRRPFQGDDVLAVMNAAATASFTPPRELRPDLPERFVKAIEGCLKVDRDERFDTCELLLQALDEGSTATVATSQERESTPGAARRRSTLPTEPTPAAPPQPGGGSSDRSLVIAAISAVILAIAVVVILKMLFL
jgi:serine/threonine protein kinase